MAEKPKFDPAQFLEDEKHTERKFDPKEFVERNDELPGMVGPGAEGAAEVLFRLTDIPLATLKSAIAAAQDKKGGLGDKAGAAVEAAGETFTNLGEGAPPYTDIVSQDAQVRGLPEGLADQLGRNADPILNMASDPLNAVPTGGVAAGRAVKGAAEVLDAAKAGVITELVPEGEFFKLANEAKPGLKDRAVTTLFGPGEEAVAAYRKNPGLIDKAPGIAGIKTKIDRGVKQIRNTLTEKTRNVEAIKGSWDDAYRMKVDELKAQPNPAERHGDVVKAIEDLKGEVSRQSAESFRILESAGITIPSARLKGALKLQINQFKATPKITPEGRAAVARLEQIRANMDELPKELTGSQAKEIIQELDAARQQTMKAGEYFDKEEQIKQLFRGDIDARLKTNKAYKNAMAFLAEDTKLLKEASKRFGDARAAQSKLGQIASDGAKEDRLLLKRLSDRLGMGLDEQIDSYVGAQRVLKNRELLEQLRNGLPEAESFRAAQEDLDLANETVDRILSKLGQDSTENVVKRLLRSTPGGEESAIETRNVVKDFQSLTGIDLSEDLAAEQLKRAFDGGKTNGARAVTMGGDIGEAAAVTLAQEMAESTARKFGAAGRALGAVYMGYVDKYGGKMARAVIDKELAMKAAGAKVNGVKLPKSMFNAWTAQAPITAKEFLRPDSQLNADGEILVEDQGMLQEIKRAIEFAPRGDMSSSEKAKLLTEINRTGVMKIQLTKEPDPPPKTTNERVFGGDEGLKTLIKSLQSSTGASH